MNFPRPHPEDVCRLTDNPSGECVDRLACGLFDYLCPPCRDKQNQYERAVECWEADKARFLLSGDLGGEAQERTDDVNDDSEWVHLDVAVIRQESEKALQVVLTNGQIHWLPFSQISDPDDYRAGDRNCTISVKRWLAVEKGLADE